MNNEIKDWVLVPRVATDAMLDAGVRGRAGGGLYGAYIEMIAAAPTPPAEASAQPDPIRDIKQALEGREGWHDLSAKVQRKGDTLLIAALSVTPPAEAQVAGGVTDEMVERAMWAPLGGGVYVRDHTSSEVVRAALSAQPQPDATFAEWLATEMPAGTIIGDPAWWANRIARQYAVRSTQPASVPVGVEGLPPDVQEMIREDKAGWALAKLAESHGAVREEDDNDLWWTLRIEQFKALAQQPAPVAPVGVKEFGELLQRMRGQLADSTADFVYPIVRDYCNELGDIYNSLVQQPAADTVTIQQAWEWAGGNPGIKATREELEEALRGLDAVCDDADQQPAAEGNRSALAISAMYANGWDWDGDQWVKPPAGDFYRTLFERAMETAREAMDYVQTHVDQFDAKPGDDKLAIVCREFLIAQQPAPDDSTDYRCPDCGKLNYKPLGCANCGYELPTIAQQPAAVDELEREEIALKAYGRADYEWRKRDPDDRDEPRHRFAMRAAIAALAQPQGEG